MMYLSILKSDAYISSTKNFFHVYYLLIAKKANS